MFPNVFEFEPRITEFVVINELVLQLNALVISLVQKWLLINLFIIIVSDLVTSIKKNPSSFQKSTPSNNLQGAFVT